MGYKILAINPGSTSTKVALYDEERPLLELNLRHSTEEISRFAGVNAQMKHACNLGGLLAAQIAHMAGVKAYIADPPVVDEMDDAARISGMPMCPRKPVFHALNQKATARLHCERMGWVYEESNLIVAHMGGGISVAAHKQGRIVDVNNALDGDGPFAPDRAGSIPSSELIKVCFSGQYTKEELLKFISSKGGLVAYLGTNSVIQVMERIAQGDQRAKKVLDAMCYNIVKQIGAMALRSRSIRARTNSKRWSPMRWWCSGASSPPKSTNNPHSSGKRTGRILPGCGPFVQMREQRER